MKRIVFLSVLCAFVLAGCDDDNPKPVEEIERDVVVYFSPASLSDVVLKSTGSAEENLVARLILYGVNYQNVVVKKFPIIANPSLTGIPLTIPIEVTTLYAIANPSTGIENANPATLANLLDLTVNFATAPESPFLMGGRGNLTFGTNVNIELVRAVAKIEVIALDDLQIESITVMNTPNQGYVFKKETIAPPTSFLRVNYPAVTAGTTVYVAENSKDNPTALEITGTYLDNPVNYTIVLKNEGLPVDIARNTFYQVSVSADPESEGTYTINISEWDDVTTDPHIIPGDKFES